VADSGGSTFEKDSLFTITPTPTPPPTPPSKGKSSKKGGIPLEPSPPPKAVLTVEVRKRPAKVLGERRVSSDSGHGTPKGRERDTAQNHHPPVSFKKNSTPFLSRLDTGRGASAVNGVSGSSGTLMKKVEKEKVELPPTPPDSDESSASGSRRGTAGSESTGNGLALGLQVGGGEDEEGETADGKRRARRTSFFGASFLGLMIDVGHGGGGRDGSRSRRSSFFGSSKNDGGGQTNGVSGGGESDETERGRGRGNRNRGNGGPKGEFGLVDRGGLRSDKARSDIGHGGGMGGMGDENEEGGSNRGRWKKFWIAKNGSNSNSNSNSKNGIEVEVK
jgi:hypothetical protein